MTSRHDPRRADARSLCARLHPDDGIHPRDLDPKETRSGADRKTMQLCAQVRRTLHGLVSADARLSGLLVESVEPAPDASRLRVTVSVPVDRVIAPVRETLRVLQPWLRCEVTAAIARKRAPELSFELVPREPDANVEPDP